jgi:dTDP-4-dehydrorhamnose reductase
MTLEMWGGHECTVNRVGETFYDQTRRSGHHDRLGDLDLFAGLGINALRYPILWERTAPHRSVDPDFTWSDARLERMDHLGLRPIVGLLHHGGGPRHTDLLDPAFPDAFAAYARAVARRYPQIADWTPINEPLTTARFSCLYGHWYPHRTDERSFWLALLNQIEAVQGAMAAIREVHPGARLIQTEDLGRAYATDAMASQARFENDRRWLTWDLLCGLVQADHPLFDRIARFAGESRVKAIADNPTPPDVVGVNHYLTSERYLDHRPENYPEATVGGNIEGAYADVEAVRVLVPGPHGLEGVLAEAWRRYGRALAVTECHNGCTREEQVRWLREAWETAQALRSRGVPVEAVTAWALLGAFDWDSLLTSASGHYETGAFDVRGREPRRTGVAHAIAALATSPQALHPVASGAGWWRRDVRLRHRPAALPVEPAPTASGWRGPRPCSRPLLITGATGVLGLALARAARWRGLDHVLTDRSSLPLDDGAKMIASLERAQPWAVINAAGWVRVDDAEQDPRACMAANAFGAAQLATACAEREILFVGFSSDLVFDGRLGRPYVETDATAPLNVYGQSKAQAEQLIRALPGRSLMVRTAAFFSPHDPHNFAAQVERNLANAMEFVAADDVIVSPTYVPDLVEAVLDLAVDGADGLWHLANSASISWLISPA